MKNKTKPIQLDKERNLRLDLNALYEFEEATGKSFFVQEDMSSLKAKDYRALLWCMLIHEDEELTLRDVGAMIDTDNFASVVKEVTAMLSEMGGGEGEDPLAEQQQ